MKYGAKNSFKVYSTSTRTEMVDFIPSDAKKILDVGCSVGNFGELLKSRQSLEVWGVEIDREAADVASTKLDKVFCGAFDEGLNLPNNYFDCIVFNDVLEHMVDPYSALEFCKQLLSENGKIVASIPNVRYFGNMWVLLVHKDWEYVDTGILDRTHLRFFTIKSITSTFKNLGFNIETITGIAPLDIREPCYIKKFKILNLLTFNSIEDMRWLQFAVVASPNK